MESGALIFVRDQSTLRFLNYEGAWVTSFADAAIFATTGEAFAFCLKQSVHMAEVVMRVGDPRYDIKLIVP